MNFNQTTVKQRREKLFADPKFQAFLKAKIDAAEEFYASAKLIAIRKNTNNK